MAGCVTAPHPAIDQRIARFQASRVRCAGLRPPLTPGLGLPSSCTVTHSKFKRGKLDDKMVETFKANKVEVITLTDAEAEAWRGVAQKTSYKQFAEKVPGGKELIEKALSVK